MFLIHHALDKGRFYVVFKAFFLLATPLVNCGLMVFKSDLQAYFKTFPKIDRRRANRVLGNSSPRC